MILAMPYYDPTGKYNQAFNANWQRSGRRSMPSASAWRRQPVRTTPALCSAWQGRDAWSWTMLPARLWATIHVRL